MTRRNTFCGVVVSVLFVLAGVTHATQIELRTARQIGEESSLVVRGTVTNVRSFWDDSRTKILTEAMITVDEAYKGDAGGSARVLQLGGIVGTVRMHVHGAPSWTSGEEVLLFLEPIDADSYRVSGLSQGKFKVERDPVTGEPFVTYPEMEGAGIVGARSTDGGRAMPMTGRVPLERFIADALGRR